VRLTGLPGLPGRAMRALVLRDYYDIAVEERPDPVAGPGMSWSR
jgi:hypothetical protein